MVSVCFPALETGCMFSLARQKSLIFPRLVAVGSPPEKERLFVSRAWQRYMFSRPWQRLSVSRAWQWLHVFTRFAAVACFPALGSSSLFPALGTRCTVFASSSD